MKRVASVLLVVAIWPLLTAGGGVNPPSFSPRVDNQVYSATIVMDPHMAQGDPTPFDYNNNSLRDDVVPHDITPPSSKHATIYLRKGGTTAQASFRILPKFALFRGCDLTRTEQRFLFTPITNPATLTAWVPPLELKTLFIPFGVTVGDNVVPAITAIRSARCVDDPLNPGPISDGGDGPSGPLGPDPTIPGFLHMEVDIRLLTP